MKHEAKQPTIKFQGSQYLALSPVIIFLIICMIFFIGLKAFEMHALAAGAFVSLLISALFVKPDSYDAFWNAVVEGAKESVPVVILLLIIGMFSSMISSADISSGFVWLAGQFNVSGGLFTAMTFLFVALIATATGSSLGTMFTCFPIFFPAGVLLGSNPAALTAAITCGGIFGDNLAPISDTTIISASTQYYNNRTGTVGIGEAVLVRFKYCLIAGIFTFLMFMFVGDSGEGVSSSVGGMIESNPQSLIMLIPIVVMLGISIKHGSMYLAITAGLVVGIVIGLVSGIFVPADILSVVDGAPTGFLTDGVANMMGITVLVMSVYGIMGVLTEAGLLDMMINHILNSKLSQTVRGTELVMLIGINITTMIFGGVTSASMTTFGKIQNELGKRKNIHPARRSNLLDGGANSLGVTIPFLSVFVFIGSQLTAGYDGIAQVSVTQLSGYMFYSFALFAVLLFSILTGWGRDYEGKDGARISQKEYEANGAVASDSI